MISNYFRTALRNVQRHPVHTFLNLGGLSIGMACAILILLWVEDEWSYDRHIKNASNIYRVIENENPADKGSMIVPVPGALASGLKEQYPEIIRSARYIPEIPLTLQKGQEFIEETVAVADGDFLKMFDIRLLEGDIQTALSDPHNIILTEETARKFFGRVAVVGKTISSRGFDMKVTGVIKDQPYHSHIQFKYLISIQLIKEFGGNIDGWNERFHIYVQLKKGVSGNSMNEKIRDYLKSHVNGSSSEIFLQNIRKIHLFSAGKYAYDVRGNGDIQYVRILGWVALFILLIACINFMNLSTAQSSMRAKEIGVRKLAGAGRKKLIVQFMGESLIIVLVAHILSMILVELLLPSFNNLSGKDLVVHYGSMRLHAGLLSVIILCGLVAGSYPALFLSSLKPLQILKGIYAESAANIRFSSYLVIFQFTLSVALIICTMTVGKQLHYMLDKNPGFNRNHVGYFMFPTRPGDPRLESLKRELKEQPEITDVTKGHNPVNFLNAINGFRWTGKDQGHDMPIYFMDVDVDYAKTFQMEMQSGRFFSTAFPTDSFKIVINEQAASLLAFNNPLGEKITTPWGATFDIIGVVKDFHFKSLHYKIEPLIMHISPSNTFFIRMKAGNNSNLLESVNRIFQSYNPGLPLDFHYMDSDFEGQYQTERKMRKIFICFSLLAVLISCLGLIGLSSFMTERRTKEIGIRKANGAKSNQIFLLLSKQYMLWVLISIMIASPVAWYFMHKWLRNFAYRTEMGIQIFLLAGVTALVIAFATVGFKSYQSASKNPVKALRYE